MIDPLIWLLLLLSFLLVSVSLTAVLMVLVPTVRELSRAARSVEKLCDTLNRELPPTLDSIRQTSLEITELTDDVTPSVQTASRAAQQVDQGVNRVRQQAKRVEVGTRSLMVGVRAAWQTLKRSSTRDRRRLSPGPAPRLNPLTTAQPASSLSSKSQPQGQLPQGGSVTLSQENTSSFPELPSGNITKATFTPTLRPLSGPEEPVSTD